MKYIFGKINDFFYNFFDFIIAIAIMLLAIFIVIGSYANMIKESTGVELETSIKEYKEIETTKSFVVSIPNLVDTESLAEILKSYKIIDDKDDFIEYFNEKSDIDLVKSKDVELNTSMSYDEIIEAITK